MKTISVYELKERLDKKEVILIDVREPAEHRSESIDGACLVPLGEISLEKLPSLQLPIVFYCRTGNRSCEACAILLASDPSLEVYSLEGGIVAWRQAGYDLKKTGATILSLDRQTQIAVGLITFSGTLLGAIINSFFYLLPGFMGVGLMFAGVTGWCGMAKLLAKMPWNK